MVSFLSQTNNASGFPLAYPQFNKDGIQSFLTKKVVKTIELAGINAIRCQVKNFISVFEKVIGKFS